MHRAAIAVVLVASGCDGGKYVNYKVNISHAPVCADDGDTLGNNLKRTLVLRADTTSKYFVQMGTTGQRFPGPNPTPIGMQVMLKKNGGPQVVKFKFGACPAKEKPTGRVRNLGCADHEIDWYGKQEVTLDPKDLVIFGESGESKGSIELPWPANELPCWTQNASAWSTPL